MIWEIIKENKRQVADESYYLKATKNCPEGKIILEIEWAQIMYAITVDLVNDAEDELLYCCMVFCEDRIEKYGHQIIRMTQNSTIDKLKKLEAIQKDAVLNCILSEKYGVTYKGNLPEKESS